jgi:hypothetical protein
MESVAPARKLWTRKWLRVLLAIPAFLLLGVILSLVSGRRPS